MFSKCIHILQKQPQADTPGSSPGVNKPCMASHWLALLPSLIFVLLSLSIATKMVSAVAETTFTFGTDPAFNFEMILRWTINVRLMEGRHKTITMLITRLPENFMVVKIWCFPATYLEALSTSISSSRQWKNNHLLQNSIVGWHDSDSQ